LHPPERTTPASRLRRLAAVVAVAGLGLFGRDLLAQPAVRPRFDVRVPMRDGVTLSADLWMPSAPGRYPTILMRTPYLRVRAGVAKLAHFYVDHGFAFAIQDTRGRGDSDGRFSWLQDDGPDGYDTIEWLAAQPWSDGKVAMAGGSYVGTVQWLAARERPPHLVCLLPKAAAGRWFDETPYLGGALLLGFALTWSNLTAGRLAEDANAELVDWPSVFAHRPLISSDSVLGRSMPVYQSWLAHPTFDDFWQRITLTDNDFARIDLPALTVTGWFDADQPGALHYWRGMRARSPARDRQYLVVGPWQHVATIYGKSPLRLGELTFTPESVVDANELDLHWFESCLRGAYDAPRARLYLTGLDAWRDFDDYPPAEAAARSVYLHSAGRANTATGDGALDWRSPAAEPPDRYTYDPRQPIPIAEVAEDGVDQRHLEARDDILVYTSPPLGDTVLAVGPASLELWAASDARDTDFMAKLMDVYPDGRAVKLGAKTVGVIRARYRLGYDREVPLTPGRPERMRIDLFDVGHAFLPGHRIRIDLSSSASPAVAPNSNTGRPIATDTAAVVAHQLVYHDRDHPSRLILSVLPRSAPR
jgi:uncharacterized protein